MGKAVDNLVESLGAGLVQSLTKWLRLFKVGLRVVFIRLLAPLGWSVAFRELRQWPDNGGIVDDERTVISAKSQKGLKSLQVHRLRPTSYCLYLGWVR